MTRNIVSVNDKMQRGYSYEVTEPSGLNFAEAFKPELTPKLMLVYRTCNGVGSAFHPQAT